jgi:large subunit ribosomal protein LP2
MKVVAAYLLAVLGGNANPDAAAINKILSSVGIEAKGENVDKLIAQLKGKNVEDVIAEGTKKLAALPAGGAAVASAPAKQEAVKEAPKEDKKKKEEPKEEEDEVSQFFLNYDIYKFQRIWASDFSIKRTSLFCSWQKGQYKNNNKI